MKTLLTIFTLALTSFSSKAFDHSHAAFTAVLRSSVKGDSVDYKALKKQPDALGSYLVELAKVDQTEFKTFTEKQQLSYLINLYNAGTLKLIIDNYPLKSIRDLKSPWKQKRIKLFGKNVSLDHIEHEVIREDYNEPRIHFAVNCASIGCPPLRHEAFTAKKLETQFEEQTRAFLNDPTKNRIDSKKGVLYLSSIFDWFGKDFIKKSGSVVQFIAPYREDDSLSKLQNHKIKFSDYDWALNSVK